MENKRYILQMIKDSVRQSEPGATLILYGSYARGEEREDSDIDVLIVIDSDKDKIRWKESEYITHRLLNIEIATSVVISPVIYSKKGWANHRITPYYENVNKEGIVL